MNNEVNEKIGIIDVGGGLRGVYTAGVFDYLLDNKIYLPYTIGISAGSANVAAYVSKQRGRNLKFYLDYTFEKDYMSMHNFLKTGSYIGLDYIYGTISNEDGKNPWDYDMAMRNDSQMIVVATNAQTGEPEYFYKKDFKKNDYGFFSASCCIPIINKPYEYHGKKYFDGGISNPIPIEKAFEDGCDKVIILLTRELNERKLDSPRKQRAYKLIKNKYPKVYDKLMNRCNLYNDTLDFIKENYVPEGKVLIVAPDDKCGMSTLTKNKEKMKKLYDKGYKDGEKIKEFIKK